MTAIEASIAAIKQGARFCVLENVSLAGQKSVGTFCVIVDDGSGVFNPDFLQMVTAAVDSVRPIGTTFAVTQASVLPVTIGMTVVASAAGIGAGAVVAIQQAIS